MATSHSGRGGMLVAGLGFGVAAGVALGTLVIAPNTPGTPGAGRAASSSELDQARRSADVAEAQAKTADAVVDELAGPGVADTLTDRPVLLMRTADAVDADVEAVAKLLDRAGATDAGRITLTEKFTSRDGADKLKTIVTNTLPTGAQLSEDRLDPGTHAGEALAPALLLDPDSGEPQSADKERAALLGALADDGFLDYERGTVRPAQLIVLVTGGADGSGGSGFGAQVVSNMTAALQDKGNGVVLAGRIGSAADTGAIGLLRAAGLPDSGAGRSASSVDSVDRAWGRIATVLAAREQLDGRAGAYGAAESADAATPQVPTSGD